MKDETKVKEENIIKVSIKLTKAQGNWPTYLTIQTKRPGSFRRLMVNTVYEFPKFATPGALGPENICTKKSEIIKLPPSPITLYNRDDELYYICCKTNSYTTLPEAPIYDDYNVTVKVDLHGCPPEEALEWVRENLVLPYLQELKNRYHKALSNAAINIKNEFEFML